MYVILVFNKQKFRAPQKKGKFWIENSHPQRRQLKKKTGALLVGKNEPSFPTTKGQLGKTSYQHVLSCFFFILDLRLYPTFR